MTDCKDKIRKLLSLAQSSNPNEAKAALLKARALMAEYKLSEAECLEPVNQTVVSLKSGFTASKRRDPWLLSLAAVIGEHYCCKSYREHRPRKQTQVIGFIGFADDVDVCLEVYRYAANFVLQRKKETRRDLKGYPGDLVIRECNSYGYGFVHGLRIAFENQQKEASQKWGLALTISPEVQNACRDFGHEKFESNARKQLYRTPFDKGIKDGMEFQPNRTLKESSAL